MNPENKPALLILATVLVLVPISMASALDPPPLTGRVMDRADMLGAWTEDALRRELKELEEQDSTQIVVLTIPGLGGDDIASFGIRLAESWTPGQAGFDNGAILIISRDEHLIRIEKGYGLEDRLTDLIAGRIIREIMVPWFQAGQFDKGVMDGVGAMIESVSGEYNWTELQSQAAVRRQRRSLLSFALYAALLTGVFTLAILTSKRRNPHPGRGYSKIYGVSGYRGYSGGSSGGSGGGFSGGGGGFGGGGATGGW